MYPLGPAAHAVPGVICLEVFYDSRKGNCNDDDRRQWRIEGGVVGAVASKVRVQLHEAAAGSHNLGCRAKRD